MATAQQEAAITAVLALVDPNKLDWMQQWLMPGIPQAVIQSKLKDWRALERDMALRSVEQGFFAKVEDSLFQRFPFETIQAIGYAPPGPLAAVTTAAGTRVITPAQAEAWGATGVLNSAPPTVQRRKAVGLAIAPPSASSPLVVDSFTGEVIGRSQPTDDALNRQQQTGVPDLTTSVPSSGTSGGRVQQQQAVLDLALLPPEVREAQQALDQLDPVDQALYATPPADEPAGPFDPTANPFDAGGAPGSRAGEGIPTDTVPPMGPPTSSNTWLWILVAVGVVYLVTREGKG